MGKREEEEPLHNRCSLDLKMTMSLDSGELSPPPQTRKDQPNLSKTLNHLHLVKEKSIRQVLKLHQTTLNRMHLKMQQVLKSVAVTLKMNTKAEYFSPTF